MKMLLLLFLGSLPIHPFALAVPWSEIDTGSLIRMKTDLPVTTDFILAADSRFSVDSADFFGPPFFQRLTLGLHPCPETLARRKIEMVILEDLYGFELDWNCKISLYLEPRDLGRESYFEKVE